VTCINADISDVNKAFFIFNNSLEMFPRNAIWPRSRQIIAFDDSTLEFLIGQRYPYQREF